MWVYFCTPPLYKHFFMTFIISRYILHTTTLQTPFHAFHNLNKLHTIPLQMLLFHDFHILHITSTNTIPWLPYFCYLAHHLSNKQAYHNFEKIVWYTCTRKQYAYNFKSEACLVAYQDRQRNPATNQIHPTSQHQKEHAPCDVVEDPPCSTNKRKKATIVALFGSRILGHEKWKEMKLKHFLCLVCQEKRNIFLKEMKIGGNGSLHTSRDLFSLPFFCIYYKIFWPFSQRCQTFEMKVIRNLNFSCLRKKKEIILLSFSFRELNKICLSGQNFLLALPLLSSNTIISTKIVVQIKLILIYFRPSHLTKSPIAKKI